jgi:hypothetical protein
MKRFSALLTATGLLLLASSHAPAEDSAKPASESKSAPATSTSDKPSLRKPGFVFMELSTTRGEDYLSYFESVAGFKEVSRKGPGYIQAQSDHAELTFLAPSVWSQGHVFSGKLSGSGYGLAIEIGIVVADLDKAYAAALKFKDNGFPISTGIVHRPWGVRDFRVQATEGYYFRFTEGH